MESSAETPHVGGLVILDGLGPAGTAGAGFGYDRLLQLLEERLSSAPRYRQRPRTLPGWAGRLTDATWADDPGFDIAYHVRRCILPRAGGGLDQVLDFAGRVLSRPLVRNRPPWEMYLVEGIVEGVGERRAAIVTKVHPALTEGPDGADPTELLFDPTPEPRRTVAPIWAPVAEPGVLEVARRAARHAIRPLTSSPLAAAPAVGRAAAAVCGLVGGVATGAIGAVVGAVGGSADWPLQGRVGDQLRVAVARTDLSGLERVAAEFGEPVGELVPAVISGALRGWLLSRGVTLRAGSSVRAVAGRHVLDLPVGEPDPLLRLAQVRHATRSPHSPTAGAGAGAGVGVGERSMTRRQPELTLMRGVDLSGPRYAAGARVSGLHALPPVRDGRLLAIGATVFDGSLCYGLSGDWSSVRDLDLVAHFVEQSTTELVDAVAARAVGRTGS